MHSLAAIFALLTGIAGWYYLFFSKAASRLAGVEDEALNRRRVRFRRAGGVAMLLLAVCFYAGFYAVDADVAPGAFLAVWVAVFVLLLVVMVLAIIDVRLTARIRQRRRGRRGD